MLLINYNYNYIQLQLFIQFTVKLILHFIDVSLFVRHPFEYTSNELTSLLQILEILPGNRQSSSRGSASTEK